MADVQSGYFVEAHERLKRMGVFDLRESMAADGYAFLVELVDLDLRHLQPGSAEAYEALDRHRAWIAKQYEAVGMNSASEYAVGFPGTPAFVGERTAIAKAFALMIRAGGYDGRHTHGWIGRRWWIEDGAIRSEAVFE